jgi:hypothetical protein
MALHRPVASALRQPVGMDGCDNVDEFYNFNLPGWLTSTFSSRTSKESVGKFCGPWASWHWQSSAKVIGSEDSVVGFRLI